MELGNEGEQEARQATLCEEGSQTTRLFQNQFYQPLY